MYTVAQPNFAKKDKGIKLNEFWPLPWEDQPEEKEKLSKAEIKKMFKKWDKLEFKKQNN